jgi:hypothetical protein
MSASPRPCSPRRSPRASPTAANRGSSRHASRPERRSRSSTSPSSARSAATWSSTSASSTSCTRRRTWCFWARRGPGRRTWRSRSRSAPASPGSGSRSPPRPSGWRGSATPSAEAGSPHAAARAAPLSQMAAVCLARECPEVLCDPLRASGDILQLRPHVLLWAQMLRHRLRFTSVPPIAATDP